MRVLVIFILFVAWADADDAVKFFRRYNMPVALAGYKVPMRAIGNREVVVGLVRYSKDVGVYFSALLRDREHYFILKGSYIDGLFSISSLVYADNEQVKKMEKVRARINKSGKFKEIFLPDGEQLKKFERRIRGDGLKGWKDINHGWVLSVSGEGNKKYVWDAKYAGKEDSDFLELRDLFENDADDKKVEWLKMDN